MDLVVLLVLDVFALELPLFNVLELLLLFVVVLELVTISCTLTVDTETTLTCWK